jgi:predicted permease
MPGGPHPDREVAEELEFHLQMRAEELVGVGLSPEDARRQAEEEFGDLDETLRYCRHQDRRRSRRIRVRGLIRSVRDEVALALRGLGRRPASVVAPMAILTLAVALNALVLSVVRGVLFSPLPFAEEDRVVVVEEVLEEGDARRAAYPIVEAWRREGASAEVLSAYMDTPFPLQTETGPIFAEGAVVTRGFFDLFTNPLLRGRGFLSEEHATGANPVVVVSEGLWKGAYGQDPGILGRRIELEGRLHQVVGVVRDEAVFPDGTQLWVPVEQGSPQILEVAGAKIMVALARLRPGAVGAAVEEELGRISAAVVGGAPGAAVVPLGERLLGDVRRPLLLLQGAVLLVLLAATVNAGGLFLARGVRRRGEVALRASLGAGSVRVGLGLLLEGVLLGGAAGVAGLALAAVALGPALALVPGDLPRASHIGLDPWVVALALILACLTGLASALASALAGSRTSPATLLRESTPAAGSSPWIGKALEGMVVVQVALAVLLTAGAGLLLRSFVSTLQEDPGFDAANVVLVNVSLPEYRYADQASRVAFSQELLERSGGLPGVQAVALGRNLPISGSNMTSPLRVEGFGGMTEAVQVAAVTDGYFQVMRIPFLEGSGFDGADRVGGPMVLIVDPGVAAPGGQPLGVGDRAHSLFGDRDYRDILGVVGAVRHRGLRVSPVPIAYEPFFQKGGASGFTLLIRSDAPTGAVATQARQLVQSLDPSLPVDQVSTMASRIQASLAEPRFYTMVLSIFGALAVLLALAGCQAGLAHRVASRRREIGIRMALGATLPSVRAMVMGRGLALTGVGLALGILAAIPGTRLLESQLYGITPGDPFTYGALLVLLLVAGALASDAPARRAATVDPAEILKEG